MVFFSSITSSSLIIITYPNCSQVKIVFYNIELLLVTKGYILMYSTRRTWSIKNQQHILKTYVRKWKTQKEKRGKWRKICKLREIETKKEMSKSSKQINVISSVMQGIRTCVDFPFLFTKNCFTTTFTWILSKTLFGFLKRARLWHGPTFKVLKFCWLISSSSSREALQL